MGKRVALIHKNQRGESRSGNTALVLLSLTFLLGGVLGWTAEAHLSSGCYVQSFLDAAGDHSLSAGMKRDILAVCRWPVLVLVMGVLPFAGGTIPILFCCRGFLLSYSIAAFLEAGIWEAVLLFGPTCLLTLPVLFVLAVNSLLKKAGEPAIMRPAVILACLLALALCVVVNHAMIPSLLSK